mmetsp:Transcript_89484/g.253552  ORF Transcript_89484/g.253552 Transcript_89484/m.253552 type:complete len:298 (-) Transcript_89484:245-1138(-)
MKPFCTAVISGVSPLKSRWSRLMPDEIRACSSLSLFSATTRNTRFSSWRRFSTLLAQSLSFLSCSACFSTAMIAILSSTTSWVSGRSSSNALLNASCLYAWPRSAMTRAVLKPDFGPPKVTCDASAFALMRYTQQSRRPSTAARPRGVRPMPSTTWRFRPSKRNTLRSSKLSSETAMQIGSRWSLSLGRFLGCMSSTVAVLIHRPEPEDWVEHLRHRHVGSQSENSTMVPLLKWSLTGDSSVGSDRAGTWSARRTYRWDSSTSSGGLCGSGASIRSTTPEYVGLNASSSLIASLTMV